MKSKYGISSILANLDLIFTGIVLIILVLLTFVGVIMRHFFNNPIIWQEEVQVWCILWVVFLSAGAVFRTIGHVSIEIFVDMMPKKLAWVVEMIGYLVVMVVLFYTMLRGFDIVAQLYTTQRNTNILYVPYGVLYLSLPVGCILMMINYTASVAKSHFFDYFRKSPLKKGLV